jgi:hypothetical protein
MIRYSVKVFTPSNTGAQSLIEEDFAEGNTPRTAKAAANGLARQLQGFYPAAVVTVSRERSTA